MSDNAAQLRLRATRKLSLEFRMLLEDLADVGNHFRQLSTFVEDQQRELGISPGRIVKELIYLLCNDHKCDGTNCSLDCHLQGHAGPAVHDGAGIQFERCVEQEFGANRFDEM
jgi:hypothetical protein